MTRILSQLLEASEPRFRQQLGQLERASGHNITDIKLTVEVVHAAKQKIHELGLDKHNTTSQELYHALKQRVTDDDRRLERALRTRAATYVSAEADLYAGMLHALQAEANGMTGFGMKVAAIKRQLKKMPPKRLQKMLGYRSVDAMLRHEQPSALVSVALAIESSTWSKHWLDSYKSAQPADFEARRPMVIGLSDSRWQAVAEKLVYDQAHTVFSRPELGSMVIMPIPQERPAAMIITTTALALHELNTISATASFLRASQVHGDFGERVYDAARGVIELQASIVRQVTPWHLVQRHFANNNVAVREEIFGPYAQKDDFTWRSIESQMVKLCPALAFWSGTSHIAFLHNGSAVSLNVIDVAISACNKVSFEARELYHAQQELWSELTLRYLDHDSIEQAVASVLQPTMALEPVTEK